MKPQTIALVVFALVLSGCYKEVSLQKTTTAADFPKKWAPAVSLEAAQHFSSDQAKAILIARAAVEEQNRAGDTPPAILDFDARPNGDGWSVHVTFVGLYDAKGTPQPGPGYFCTVQIDKDWNITQITGGA